MRLLHIRPFGLCSGSFLAQNYGDKAANELISLLEA